MDQSLKVLLVEDNASQAELVEEILGGPNEPVYVIEHVTRIGAAESRLQAQHFDVVLLDLHLPDSEGPGGGRKNPQGSARYPDFGPHEF